MDDQAAEKLTPAQQSIYFDQMLNPGSPCYNLGVLSRIPGGPDTVRLRKSLMSVVAARFAVETDGLAVGGANVPPDAIRRGEFPLEEIDLSGQEYDEAASAASSYMARSMSAVMEMGKDPLLKSAMFRMPGGDAWWFIQAHHVLSDASGLLNLIHAVSVQYNGTGGCGDDLNTHGGQGLSLAAGHRDRRETATSEESGRFWREELRQLPEPALPRGVGRNAAGISTHAASRRIPVAARRELEGKGVLCRHALRAALALYFARTGRVEEIMLGSVVHGRAKQELGSVFGMFSQILPTRIRMDRQMTVSHFVRSIAGKVKEVYRHQNYPVARMAQDAGILQGGHANLTEVSFNYIDLSAPIRFGEAQARLSFNINPCERGPVQLRLYDHGDHAEPEMVLYCRSDYFSAEETEALLARLYRIMEQMAHAGLAIKCSELDLLLSDERHRLMVEWNNTATEFPRAETVSRLFEAQVARTPDAVAAVYENEEITFAELNRRANRLARCLRDKGARPDALIGIYLERSLEMIVGLLGILKAGCAYVPLDSAYPKERLAYMLEDACPAVLITRRHLQEALPAHGVPSVCLDADDLLSGYSDANLEDAASPDNLAYVIYTSGSTGKPKGVGITHRAINRLVFDTQYVDLQPADVVAQAANSSFDAITFEIWSALLHGCRLCLIAREKILSPLDFSEEIRRNGISVLFITTALFNQFADLAPHAFRRMRYVLFGGEAVDPRAVEKVLHCGPPENLLHVYGPTESTTFASWHRVEKVYAGAATIPIGRPIANTRIYILDDNLDPVPIGAAGELFIGGEGLARCYLNRPALTAEKFIPHPFSDTPGARLYRSGDLARYLPGGHIEYVGRIDDQVKIRGFRIEPGEIEAALTALPSVCDAVVLAREDTPGDKRLVAYVVVRDESQIDEQAFRQSLLQRLPDYMVPAHFVCLKQLPLTPNGKVDRKALPVPDMTRGQTDYVAPRTQTEEMLAGIWAKTLKLDRVGIHDNFFALGGHSLLATQMMSRARQEFGIDLPLRTIFETLTISALAPRYDEMLELARPSDADQTNGDLEEVEY